MITFQVQNAKLLFPANWKSIFHRIVEVIMSSLLNMDVLQIGKCQTSMAKETNRSHSDQYLISHCNLNALLYALCMLYACCMSVVCMLYACCMRVVCVLHACCMHVVCVLYACCIHVVCVLYACCMRVVCMLYAHVPCLNFKPCHVAISEGLHVAVGILSSAEGFQGIKGGVFYILF